MREEAGFTLVELLIASVVSVIIMGAIAASMIVMLKNVDTTQEQLSDSHDAQITSAYFANDVQGSDLQSASPMGINAKTLTCGPTADTTALATFTTTTDSGVVTTKYFVKTVGTERQLQRTIVGGNTNILAHGVGKCGTTGTADASVKITTSSATGPNHYLLTVANANGLTFKVAGEKRVR